MFHAFLALSEPILSLARYADGDPKSHLKSRINLLDIRQFEDYSERPTEHTMLNLRCPHTAKTFQNSGYSKPTNVVVTIRVLLVYSHGTLSCRSHGSPSYIESLHNALYAQFRIPHRKDHFLGPTQLLDNPRPPEPLRHDD